jgi:hypothetical protein
LAVKFEDPNQGAEVSFPRQRLRPQRLKPQYIWTDNRSAEALRHPAKYRTGEALHHAKAKYRTGEALRHAKAKYGAGEALRDAKTNAKATPITPKPGVLRTPALHHSNASAKAK